MRASCLVVLASVLAACGGGSSHQRPILPDYPTSACATFNTRSLVYAYPAPEQTEVVPGAPVVLRFTHPLANTNPVSAASLFTITNVKTAATVPFAATVVDGGRTVVLRPTAMLAENTTYRVGASNIPVVDDCADSPTKGTTGSIALGTPVLRFTVRPVLNGAANAQTRDASKFQVTNVLPDNSVFPLSLLTGPVPVTDFATLRLQFSQPLQAATAVYGGTVSLKDAGGTLVSARLLVSGNHVAVDPVDDLDPAKTYTLSLTAGIKSSLGQSLTAWSRTFQPRDTGGPKPGSSASANDGTHQTPIGDCPGPSCDKRSHLEIKIPDTGTSVLTGTVINQVPVSSPLLGNGAHNSLASGSLFADLSMPMDFSDKLSGIVPLRVGRNNLISAASLDVKLDGKVPAGLRTGVLAIKMISDANGLLLPNRYSSSPVAPALVTLEMDIALGAADPTSNGAFTQNLLHVPVSGIAVIGEDASGNRTLTIEALGVIELKVLGVDDAVGVLALKLVSVPSNEQGSLAQDTTLPKVQSWVPGAQTTSGLPAGDLVRPGDPIIVTFDETMDAGSFKDVLTLSRDGSAEPFSWRLDGNSLVITPITPLVHGSTYNLTVGQARDLAGNALAAPALMTFTVPALATSKIRPPVVLSVYPGYPCATSSSGRNLAGGLQGRCAGGKSDDDVLPLPGIDPQRDLRVVLSQSIAPASVKLGTACNTAASFRVERVDISGNCLGVVPGRLTVNPREITFKPNDAWVKNQLYRYVLGSNNNLTSSAADCSGTQAICGSNGLPLQTQLIAQTLADAQNSQRGGPPMEIFFKGGNPLSGTSIGLRVLPVLDVNANYRLDDTEVRSLKIDEAGNYVSPNTACRTGQGSDAPATTGRCVAANGALLQPDRMALGTGKSYTGAATYFALGCKSGVGSEDESSPAVGRDCQGNQFLLITAALGARLGSSVDLAGKPAIEVFIDPSIVVTSGTHIYADLGLTSDSSPVSQALFNALRSIPILGPIIGNAVDTGAGLIDGLLPISARDATNTELEEGHIYTGPLVFRMRYPAGNGPIKGYITSEGGKLVLEAGLDLYTDIPEINPTVTILGQSAIPIDHAVRSSPDLTASADTTKGSGTVRVRGEVKFLPDGRMTVQLSNIAPVRLTASLSALGGLLAGDLKVRVPTGRFIIDASLAPIKPVQ